MKKKSELHYELYGSSGHWRWAIYAGREKKPLLVGSFSGTLDDAKEHAEAAILRLKQRARKRMAHPQSSRTQIIGVGRSSRLQEGHVQRGKR
jgi:hypothetical protein